MATEKTRQWGLVFLLACAWIPHAFLPGNPLVTDATRAIAANPSITQHPVSEICAVHFLGLAADTPFGTGSFRPLVSLTWALQARLFGLHPALFHLVEMVLHDGVGLLVAPYALNYFFAAGTLPVFDGFLAPRVLAGIVLVAGISGLEAWRWIKRRDPEAAVQALLKATALDSADKQAARVQAQARLELGRQRLKEGKPGEARALVRDAANSRLLNADQLHETQNNLDRAAP